MLGISEPREPIKGEFAKKLRALVNKMRQRKIEKQEELKKEYEEEKIHNVIRIDENFD